MHLAEGVAFCNMRYVENCSQDASGLVFCLPMQSSLRSSAGSRSSLWRNMVLVVCLFALSLFVVPAATLASTLPGYTFSGLKYGRVWTIAADPASASILIAGTDNGIYRSVNGGVAWTHEGLSGVRVWAVAFLSTGGTVLAGTAGRGVYLSPNAGSSWQGDNGGLSNLDVRDISVVGKVAALGTNNGVFLSATGGPWSFSGLASYSISAIAIVGSQPLTIMAGVDAGPENNGFLFKSVGTSTAWSPLQNGLPAQATVSSLAVGPVGQAGVPAPVLVATSLGTFVSTDNGTSWTASKVNGLPSGVTVNFSTLTFDPENPNVVYAGDDWQGSTPTGPGLFRSTDGGATFTPLEAGILQSHQEVEVISVANGGPPLLVIGVNLPSGQAIVYPYVDRTAPAPVSVIPSASAPAVVVPGPTPSVPATPGQVAPAAHRSGKPIDFGVVLRWPFPLAPELLVLLLIGYLVVRWMQDDRVEKAP